MALSQMGGGTTGADLSKGLWQMVVGSCGYSSLVMRRVTACKVVAFH